MSVDQRSGDDVSGRQRPWSATGLLHVVAVALLPVLALFLGYEILERAWLGSADGHLIQQLHRVRGAAAALLAAAGASWLLLRDAPPLLRDGAEAGDAGFATPDARQTRLRYARWFIVMRWIAVLVASVLVVTAVEFAEILPAHVGPRLGAVVVALALLNLLYTLYLRRGAVGTGFLVVQTYADVAALLVMLHLAGGVENPLTPLLLLHVIIAGIVLGRVHCYSVAGVASVLFALLTLGELTGTIPHYTLTVFPHVQVGGVLAHAAHDPLYAGSRVLLQTVILLLVAYFTTTLVERIREDERHLERSADRALAQTQLLERALDTAGAGLCVCDQQLRTQWSNRRWDELAASAPSIGCGVHADGSASALTLADGEVRVAEVHADGPAARTDEASLLGGRVIRVTTAPLRARDGAISHVVTLARDVTAEHEAQARLLRTERLAAVGELAGRIAHEVNNPVAIISTKVRLLLRRDRGELPVKLAGELGKIVDLADRVARVAQGLLSYCRPAPGMRAPQDVRVPMRRALAFLETRAAAAGVRLVDRLPDQLPQVDGNASELEQVFLNLFLNALDAMPRGGRLRVTARADTRWVEAIVEDTGSGIAPEHRDRVFEPFYTTKPEGTGSGLGLSICLGLVRSHGGEVEIDSAPHRPTRVTVRLPAGPVAAATPPRPALRPSAEPTTHA